jgi:hypothetical protein
LAQCGPAVPSASRRDGTLVLVRAIDRLLAQFPPAADSIERGVEDGWPDMQARVGSVLPRDYKDFINAYGSACVNRFLRIHNPFSERPFVNLHYQIARTLSAWRTLKAEHGATICPYPLWFEPGGLLPWATTDNGDELFWLTTGHPDQWTVLFRGRGGEDERFAGSMVELVFAFLSGSLDEMMFGEDFRGGRTVEPNAR